MNILADALLGLLSGVKTVSIFYGILFSTLYLGKRGDSKDIKPFRWYMLLIPPAALFSVLDDTLPEFSNVSTVFVITFIVCVILGAISLVGIALHEYDRENR